MYVYNKDRILKRTVGNTVFYKHFSVITDVETLAGGFKFQ